LLSQVIISNFLTVSSTTHKIRYSMKRNETKQNKAKATATATATATIAYSAGLLLSLS
jgi:hypothetical protein